MITKIGRFIREHEDWESRLAAAPYSLNIKKKEDYVLFKYSIESDMSDPICQEARGIMFRLGEEPVCVCRGFDKFFNYNEAYAADIDWSTAEVLEKIDGTNIRLFYDQGEWHICTLGTIDAHDASVGEGYLTFGDLFLRAIERLGHTWMSFVSEADEKYTYIFELTSPESRIVIPYELGVYYLGRRNMKTGIEDNDPANVWEWIPHPQYFKLSSIEDCVIAAKELTENEEGYVVHDKLFNRVKVKGAAYLAAHHLRGNGKPTVKNVISMMRDCTLDDYVSLCPMYASVVDEILNDYKTLVNYFNSYNSIVNRFEDRKSLALFLSNFDACVHDYAFKLYNGVINCASQYFELMTPNKVADILARRKG